MSASTLERQDIPVTSTTPANRSDTAPPVRAARVRQNVLPEQLQEDWRRLAFRSVRSELTADRVRSVSWLAGGVIAFVAFSIGVTAIGWNMWLLFEGNGWIVERTALDAAKLVGAIVAGCVIWFFLTARLMITVMRLIGAWCDKHEDRQHLKINTWWQSVDRHLTSQGLPGIHRKQCTVGRWAVLEDGAIVRVEDHGDAVWLVGGWSTPLTKLV